MTTTNDLDNPEEGFIPEVFIDKLTGRRYDCSNPDFTGWLTKQSKWTFTWRRRFFMLKGSKLFFAESEYAGAPKGLIDLGERMTVRASPEHPGGIEIPTAATTFILLADDEPTRFEWISEFFRSG